MTIKQSNITTKEKKEPNKSYLKETKCKGSRSYKNSNSTKDQMRPTMLHNMENIIQNVTGTTNQSMSHHESKISNTCGTISTLDHQPLKQ